VTDAVRVFHAGSRLPALLRVVRRSVAPCRVVNLNILSADERPCTYEGFLPRGSRTSASHFRARSDRGWSSAHFPAVLDQQRRLGYSCEHRASRRPRWPTTMRPCLRRAHARQAAVRLELRDTEQDFTAGRGLVLANASRMLVGRDVMIEIRGHCRLLSNRLGHVLRSPAAAVPAGAVWILAHDHVLRRQAGRAGST